MKTTKISRDMNTVIGIQDAYTDKLERLDSRGRNYYSLCSRYAREARTLLRERCGFSHEMADKAVRDAYEIFNLAHPEIFDSANWL